MHDANDVESMEDFYSGETAMASDDGDGDYDFNDWDDTDDNAYRRQQVNLGCSFSRKIAFFGFC